VRLKEKCIMWGPDPTWKGALLGGNTRACIDLPIVDVLNLIRGGEAAVWRLATSTVAACYIVTFRLESG